MEICIKGLSHLLPRSPNNIIWGFSLYLILFFLTFGLRDKIGENDYVEDKFYCCVSIYSNAVKTFLLDNIILIRLAIHRLSRIICGVENGIEY